MKFPSLARALWRRKLETAVITAAAAVSSVGIVRGGDAASTDLAPSMAFLAPVTVTTAARPAASPEAANALGFATLDNPRVESWIRRFTTTQRGSFATYLSRMTRYDDMISAKLAKKNMPQGLIYLAMIESGFNLTAKSPVKARGLWQFMSPTARQYGLTVRGRVDERVNPARATDAALDYLSDLYDQFGSWSLAAAAYNSGQGRVARIMRQETGSTKGTDADFYRIAHRLPKETRDYVPKLVAAARIGSNPGQYGFVD